MFYVYELHIPLYNVDFSSSQTTTETTYVNLLVVVSESRVTLATSLPILVFLGLFVLELGPMYASDVRQTSDKSIA